MKRWINCLVAVLVIATTIYLLTQLLKPSTEQQAAIMLDSAELLKVGDSEERVLELLGSPIARGLVRRKDFLNGGFKKDANDPREFYWFHTVNWGNKDSGDSSINWKWPTIFIYFDEDKKVVEVCIYPPTI